MAPTPAAKRSSKHPSSSSRPSTRESGNGAAAAAPAPWPAADGLAVQRDLLALVETTGELSASRYEPRDLPSAITLARLIASSPLCPPALRGRESDVLLVMMTGAELGLSTMRSLRNLHVINGRVGMSAAMIRGRCQQHPDCERFEVVEADAGHAVVEVKKRSWPPSQRRLVTWTIAEAERAGLVTDESLWKKWPQEMCVARATTRAASMYFPEVTAGVLADEELRDLPAPQAPPLAGAAPAAKAGHGGVPGNGAPPAASTPASFSPALDAFAAGGPGSVRDDEGGDTGAAAAAAAAAIAGNGALAGRPRKGPKRAPRTGRAPQAKNAGGSRAGRR
jgi:hypothetical protein